MNNSRLGQPQTRSGLERGDEAAATSVGRKAGSIPQTSIRSLLSRVTRESGLGVDARSLFLALNERVWKRLPIVLQHSRTMTRYGAFLHKLVKAGSPRRQYHGTFFFRNRPELELLRSLAIQRPAGADLKIAVVACSNGAEVYSILWILRSARPDLKITVEAIDISEDIIELAKAGVYSLTGYEMVHSPIFERLTNEEMDAMFDRVGNQVTIKPWLQEGIHWRVCNAADPEMVQRLGLQDIVVANKFLCHMRPEDAESCLGNLSHLARPGGYVFVSGVDLDVRVKVALRLGWTPMLELLQEMHDGDPSVRRDWPLRYWGLEPFVRDRPDWEYRYASAFRTKIPPSTRSHTL